MNHESRKRKLSARMAMLTFPLILVCDLALLFVLKYIPNFKYGDIHLTPETTEALLYMLVFPSGFAALVTSIVFYKEAPEHPDKFTGTVQRLHQKILRRADSGFRYSLMLVSVMMVVLMGFVTISKVPRNNFVQGNLTRFIIATFIIICSKK